MPPELAGGFRNPKLLLKMPVPPPNVILTHDIKYVGGTYGVTFTLHGGDGVDDDFMVDMILTGDGVDVVCDSIGGSYVRRSYKTLRQGGRLVVFGGVSFATEGMLSMLWNNMVVTRILNILPDSRAVMRYQRGEPELHSAPEWVREDLAKLFDLLAEEKIKPIVTRMPLVEAARAHELIGEGAVQGKIVLMCNT